MFTPWNFSLIISIFLSAHHPSFSNSWRVYQFSERIFALLCSSLLFTSPHPFGRYPAWCASFTNCGSTVSHHGCFACPSPTWRSDRCRASSSFWKHCSASQRAGGMGTVPLACHCYIYLFGCIPGVGLIVLWVLTGPHEEGTKFGSSNGPAEEFYTLSGCFSLGGDCGKNCLRSKGMSDCEICSRFYCGCGNCCGFPNSFAPTSIDNDMEEAGAK